MDFTSEVELSAITVKPIAFTEQQQRQEPILKQVHLHIGSGEWITLLGRNGSGKSTLAKVIAGAAVEGLSGDVIRSDPSGRLVPIVMQRPEASLVGSTPWEDVVLMLEQNEAEEERIAGLAEEALSLVGLGERLHQPIGTLSGGQKQLVAIAGCIAVYSPLLVLDEATSMLDPEASALVLEQARAIHAKGTTVIWITQKLNELNERDRIVAMQDGRIAFDGTSTSWYERVNGHEGASVCERLGFDAPYTVQVAWELEKLGLTLDPFPIVPSMLAKAVSGYGSRLDA
ncbi:energy-coupling factor ABC transporter ATP-binding protein [Paenibacillus harenae]|uniref:energy-coupling factor ABC transporter ATP-binding protein n=1 Tax=Paenibacillus harenae TaxID=306543 RepID=UPI00278FD453|nr:ATP-binding cassette domain-containing protein [Paenibacillus harenae]MDQ0059753.1 energy-coupling factor transport system ATP-binding protein [Paenibacillus harenae]